MKDLLWFVHGTVHGVSAILWPVVLPGSLDWWAPVFLGSLALLLILVQPSSQADKQ